jgi:hypothetical protein
LEWIHFSIPQLIFRSLPYTLVQLAGELVTFDFVNLKGFYLAVLKFSEVIDARKQLKSDKVTSLSKILEKIS